MLTDFAADVPFAQAMDKWVEPYGVLLGESTIRRITEGHARPMFETFKPQQDWPQRPGCKVVMAQRDGGMVPIVEPDRSREDPRQGKRLHWKEAKICLAHAQGSLSVTYGGTLPGEVEVEEAGRQLFDCVSRAGFGRTSHLHAVGDGAEWITAQGEDRFGAQGGDRVDFYPVCDSLSAAAKAIHPDEPGAADWMGAQKERLKSRRAAEGVQALHVPLEAAQRQDAEAPVRRCHRYLSQRRHPLDYQQALACDLPIGSGENQFESHPPRT